MIDINSIGIIGSLSSVDGIKKISNKEGTEASFTDILSDAIDAAAEADADDKTGAIALLAGEDTEPHISMIESTKAELSLNLAIQIRNKVIDAYNEIMRMQV